MPIAVTEKPRSCSTNIAQPAGSFGTEEEYSSGNTITSRRSFDTSIPQNESIFVSLPCSSPKASAFTKRDGAGLLSITPVATVWIRVRWHGPFLARRLRRLRRALLHPDLPIPVSKLHASGPFRSSAIGHCDRLHSAPFRS